ncbi:MAG: hypothetical protein KAW92_13345 [Candidatus Cloacimonetes bacterium]|nr:hypothetical protein [Candidatus Cloacimonadota bacterium]
MKEPLSCQVCTAILIKTEINGITVYECPICSQLHNENGDMIKYKDLYSKDKNEWDEIDK